MPENYLLHFIIVTLKNQPTNCTFRIETTFHGFLHLFQHKAVALYALVASCIFKFASGCGAEARADPRNR